MGGKLQVLVQFQAIEKERDQFLRGIGGDLNIVFRSLSMQQFILTNDLNERQTEQLHNLFNQVNWKRSKNDLQTLLKNSISVGIMIASTQDLVGYSRILTDEVKCAFIFDVLVDERYRGNGLGKMLMEAILTHPKLKKIRFFDLTCPSFNEQFYKKFGFREQYVSEEYGTVTPMRFSR